MKSRFGEHSQTAKNGRPATKTSLFETNTLKAVFIAGPFTQRPELHGLGSNIDRTSRASGTEMREPAPNRPLVYGLSLEMMFNDLLRALQGVLPPVLPQVCDFGRHIAKKNVDKATEDFWQAE